MTIEETGVAPHYKCIRCCEYMNPDNNCPCDDVLSTRKEESARKEELKCCKIDENLKPNGDYKPARGLDQFLIEYVCKVCKKKIYINWS